MKRIVQCPKCEAKLAVFDIGKPISQKCPRCGNAFEIASEESKEPAAAPAPEAAAAQPGTEPAQPAEKKKSTSKVAAKKGAAKEKESATAGGGTPAAGEAAAPAAPEAAPAAPLAAEAAAATPPPAPADEKKEISLKKPVGKPALPSAPRPASPLPSESAAPAPAHGVSFLHVMVIFGLLILSIVMQVISAKKAEARFNVLESQLQAVMKQLQVLSKK